MNERPENGTDAPISSHPIRAEDYTTLGNTVSVLGLQNREAMIEGDLQIEAEIVNLVLLEERKNLPYSSGFPV